MKKPFPVTIRCSLTIPIFCFIIFFCNTGDNEMKIITTAFTEGKLIPVKYTCEGDDISPPLSWSGVPAGTQSLALIADDPDAPAGTWVHWIIYNMPPQMTFLPEAVPADSTLPSGAVQGVNDFGNIGYGGPCPPRGKPHRYYFKLYALDSVLPLGPGATKAKLLQAMKNHILAEGQIMGTFAR